MNSVSRFLVYSYRVSWGDLCAIKRTMLSILVTCLVIPILYLVGFGYGLGSGMTVEGYDYVAFLFPGIIAMTTLTACFTFTSSKITIQKSFYKCIDEMLLCPIPISSMVVGKAIMGVIRGLLSCTILIVMATLVSDDFRLSLSLVLVVILCCFVFSFLGVATGLIARNHTDVTLFSGLIITPMTFLCGTVFSLQALPQAVRYVVDALPLTHAVNVIRALSLGQEFPWASLAVILGFGIAFYSIAYYIIKRGNIS
ncbi:MAG: ABC transporter permease [Candidatus Methanogranum gryphiswaldense]|nr:MAG: ABC transporter permease [Candidatus Methanogranum sp. U3.2.1]